MRRLLPLSLLLVAPAAAQTIPTLTIADADSAVHRVLPLGSQLFVKLPATAGNGFVWSLAPVDGVEMLGEPIVAQPPGGPMVVGGPQVVTFRLRLAASGSRQLRFSYARGPTVARVASFAFTVR